MADDPHDPADDARAPDRRAAHGIARMLRRIPQPFRTILRLGMATVMILLGILGLIFPIMPGWIFLIPGIILLAPNTRFSRWIRSRVRLLSRRWRRRCRRA